MKKILFGLMSGALLLTGCDVNQMPTFDDADAFVAFTQASASIQENSADSIVIEVLCTSLEGIAAEVSVAIVEDTTANAAKVGEAFTYYTKAGSDTLTFDKKTTSQYIIVKPIDNDEFTGDKKFSMELKDAKGANLGASKTITITVGDNEHPLAAILGDYAASADDYWGSHYDWTITVAKDEEDLSKVWFQNLFPFFVANGFTAEVGTNMFYGIVNEDKTEIAIPVEQELGYKTSIMVAFEGDPDETDVMATGSNVIVKINDNGASLTFTHAIGVYLDGSGWYELYKAPLTITKK